ALLVMAAERQHHPPMAMLEIAVPGPATFGFQQWRLRLAESVQIRITRNHNFVGIGQRPACAGGNHPVNQAPISIGIGNRLGRIKSGMFKKLACRAGHDEAVVRVIRFGMTGLLTHFPCSSKWYSQTRSLAYANVSV